MCVFFFFLFFFNYEFYFEIGNNLGFYEISDNLLMGNLILINLIVLAFFFIYVLCVCVFF